MRKHGYILQTPPKTPRIAALSALTWAAGVGTELSQNRLMSCEAARGPRPLLYAGALAEGIKETKTNSLSSQPPQNRNTPIIKERGAARAGGRAGGERGARSWETWRKR